TRAVGPYGLAAGGHPLRARREQPPLAAWPQLVVPTGSCPFAGVPWLQQTAPLQIRMEKIKEVKHPPL
ncbi:hypothetical protein BHM03_00060536, partial [Ensete ventricosum]